MKNKAFTLVEIILVVALIGLLAAIILASLGGARSKAGLASTIQFAESLHHSLGAYGVGVWDFDDQVDPTQDDSGFGNDGDLVNNSSYACTSDDSPSGSGCSLQFDGTNYVNAGNNTSFNATEGVTISVWIKRTVVADWQRIVAKYYYDGGNTGSWVVYFNNADQIICSMNINGGWETTTSTTTVNLNEWTHVACSYNGSEVINYVNMNEVNAPASGLVAVSNHPVTMATSSDGSNFQSMFTGLIDQVRVYDRGMNQAQIKQLYVEGARNLGLTKEN